MEATLTAVKRTLGSEVVRTAAPGVPLEKALESAQFTDWYNRLDPRFHVKGVHVDSVDMFGPRVGFIKFKADVIDHTGKPISGIVFMRGGSVAMLPVFVCGRRYYTALCVQPRLPTGQFDFVEVPAGTVDGSGNFAGAAAREIEEELHMTVSEKELIELGAATIRKDGLWLSPGAADEMMRFYAFVKRVSKQWLAEVNGRCTGLLEEHEQITLKIAPLASLVDVPDAKTIVAHALFHNARRKGLIKIPA